MPLSTDELCQQLRALVFGGLLGPVNGRAITHGIASEDALTTTFMTTLFSVKDINEQPVKRHLVRLAKKDGKLIWSKPATLGRDQLTTILIDAKVGTLKDFTQLNQGAHAVTYKASVLEDEEGQYIVQLRYNVNIDSMNKLLMYIRENVPRNLPVPKVYPNCLPALCGLDIQVSQFVPGVLAESLYFNLPHQDKVTLVKQIACAFGNLWSLPLPRPANLIGEAIISGDPLSVSVGTNRECGHGGTFFSVSSYLQAWIKHRMTRLEAQQNIDEFKKEYLPRIRALVNTKLNTIPLEVEDVPIVITHRDMGLHNMILSASKPVKLAAIIDWESTYCLPFPTAVPTLINPMFQKDPASTCGEDFSEGEELRAAFWAEIPEWKKLINSNAAETFLDWYQFGVFLKADAPPNPNASTDEKRRLWRANGKFIERFLQKWGDEGTS